MFEELEAGIRKPTDREIQQALDDSDILEDRRWLILELASPTQIAKIKRNRVSSDGYFKRYDLLEEGPQEFLDERFKDD